MCGIAGIAHFDSHFNIHTDQLQIMADALRHRGPDDAGIYLDLKTHQCGLAHRRLSVIDPTGGKQPMPNADETVWIAYNGECYNFPDLRRQLEQKGRTFHTNSDTEVVLKIYEMYGLKVFERLEGMFALAIWDQNKRRLVLARDRLGQKPLYYAYHDRRFYFASECKALLTLPEFPRNLNRAALAEFLLLNHVDAPHTAFQDILQLPPGHTLIVDARTIARPTPIRYWSVPQGWNFEGTQSDAIEQIRSRVTEAVEKRLISDVPLGAFLSGGIDSAIIVGLMARLTDRPVTTCTIGFKEKRYNEAPLARITAKTHGTTHHEQIVEADAISSLSDLVDIYDDLFADSSALPMLLLSAMTRRHVTVALSGDGADELFGGYDRYRAMTFCERLQQDNFLATLLKMKFWERLPGTDQRSRSARLKRLIESAHLSAPQRYLNWVSLFDPGFLATFCDSEELSEKIRLRADTLKKEFMTDKSSLDGAGRADVGMNWDLKHYLPGDLNVKTDRASMAYGLEVRCPFQDHRVVELAVSLPQEWHFHRGKGKALLRRAFSDLIPPTTARQRKRGFGVPLADWFRGPLRSLFMDTVLSREALHRGYFVPEAVGRLLEENDTRKADHGQKLWALLVLELWQRKYL